MEISVELLISFVIGIVVLAVIALMVNNYTGGAENFFTGLV